MKLRWLFLPALSVFLGVAAQPAPADEACLAYCLRNFGCDPNANSECRRGCQGACRNSTCVDWCASSVCGVRSNPNYSSCRSNCQSACGPAAPYGAIAYGKDSRATGWAYNQDSASQADQVALKFCKQHGSDCEIVIRLTHSCGAVAAGASDTVTSGKGSTQDEAENDALSACRIRAGKSCAIQAWTCSP